MRLSLDCTGIIQSEPPLDFGGSEMNEDMSGLLNSDLPTSEFTRSAVVPSNHPYPTLSQSNSCAKRAFSRLYDDGIFRSDWTFAGPCCVNEASFLPSRGDVGDSNNRDIGVLRIFGLGDGLEPHAAFRGHLMTLHLKRYWDGNGQLQIVLDTDISMNQAFLALVRDVTSLPRRLLHHALRQHGKKLPLHLFELAASFLLHSYSSKSLPEAVDVAHVCIDVYARYDSDKIPHRVFCHAKNSLFRSAEALDASGDYAVAAPVYAFLGRLEPDPLNRVALYIRARQSYMSAEMYHNAEEVSIKAWHTQFYEYEVDEGSHRDLSGIRFDDGAEMSPMHALLSVYSMIAKLDYFQQYPEPTGFCHPATESEQMLAVLILLLQTAGVAVRKHWNCWPIPKHFEKAMLKPFTRSRRAKSLVTKALETPSVVHFRSTILSCVSGPVNLPPRCYVALADQAAIKAKNDKDAEYHWNNRRQTISTTPKQCANPNCDAIESVDGLVTFMQCPCSTVHYCGKECQLSHWKVHKRACPHRSATKEKRAASHKVTATAASGNGFDHKMSQRMAFRTGDGENTEPNISDGIASVSKEQGNSDKAKRQEPGPNEDGFGDHGADAN